MWMLGCAVVVPVNPYPVERWTAPVTGAGVVDSGVDAALPQLTGRIAAGRDLLAGGPRCAGHGTAASAVAPGAPIVPVRVSDGDPGDAAGVGRGPPGSAGRPVPAAPR
ncbi:hypothetical protein ADL15_30380 [Actinoplanes awajinensis subsp. mycoplanecinus]|uniref:Peptidase S8/S53 domain-containing protein n=1 Tax=Actinoplanes awajinensis subsp. mycoplanecinus TaxID=135947 RepID=A0A117MPL2_9ACTN|nr:hypothetical protein ADL15_30380 [Actinoplanes awajinensis subsp. mycoplanecinus]